MMASEKHLLIMNSYCPGCLLRLARLTILWTFYVAFKYDVKWMILFSKLLNKCFSTCI